MEEIGDSELEGEVLVIISGYPGIYEEGPIVMVYPDNVWYKGVAPGDVEEMMDSHIEGGDTIERLEM